MWHFTVSLKCTHICMYLSFLIFLYVRHVRYESSIYIIVVSFLRFASIITGFVGISTVQINLKSIKNIQSLCKTFL